MSSSDSGKSLGIPEVAAQPVEKRVRFQKTFKKPQITIEIPDHEERLIPGFEVSPNLRNEND